MRVPSSSAVTDLLNSGRPFFRADLYKFGLRNGTVLRFTSYDRSVIVPGDGTYLHTGPVFNRSRTKQKRGVQVSELTLNVGPRQTDLVGSVSWFTAARAGFFDYASFECDIAIFEVTDPVNQVGTFNWFSGAIADLPEISRTLLVMKIKSDLHRLDIEMPRNVVQPGCLNTLFDYNCGLLDSTFATNGTVTSVGGDGGIVTNIAAAADDLQLGKIVVTSGNNLQQAKRIKSQSGTSNVTLYLDSPFPFPLTPGTTITVYPGCDKTQSTCDNRFSNLNNFRGMPFVPTPETVL